MLFLEPSFYRQISYQTAITPLSQSGYGFWQASARFGLAISPEAPDSVASGIEARRWRRIQAAAETVSDPVLNPRREGGIFCCSHADSLPRLMAASVGEGPAPRQRASVEPPLKCRSAFQSLRSAGQDSRGVRIPEAWRSSGRVRMPSPRLFLSAAQVGPLFSQSRAITEIRSRSPVSAHA